MKVLSPVGTYWMIRHKPTGGWLPELAKPLRAGYTGTEPTTKGKPRIFTTERGAKDALRWWLRGIVNITVKMSDFGSLDPEPAESWDEIPMPNRKAEEMEVVKVDLSIVVQEVT